MLVKTREGGSYAKTVKAVKGAVYPTTLSLEVNKMRTREVHLLIESKSGTKAKSEASLLVKTVEDKIVGKISAVTTV